MQTIVVQGAGLERLNGVYGYARDVEYGRPEYWRVVESNKNPKKKMPDTVYRIRGGVGIPELSNDPKGMWLMYEYDAETGKGLHYYAAKVDDEHLTVPPSTGWTCIAGYDPTPTISVLDVEKARKEYQPLNAQLTDLKTRIGDLKNSGKGNNDPEVTSLVTQLKSIQSRWAELHYQVNCLDIVQKKAQEALKIDLEDACKTNFTFSITAEIHGGCAGLYDYGPTGAAIKANIVQEWRNHFIIEEDMLEVESTMLTPYRVLEASGHVAKFADYMVKDEVLGNCFRADKLLEQHFEQLLDPTKVTQLSDEEKLQITQEKASLGSYGQEELKEALKRHKVKAPDSANPLSDPFPFNLMFGTQIGPGGKVLGFLRPETAQGIFVNFDKLLQYNNGRMPFAAAQIGHAFRNEIAPRGGLIRVREFQMAEIEHFCTDDVDKVDHPKFDSIQHVRMRFLDRDNQKEEKVEEMTIGEAVKVRKIISNSTLGYYLARTQLFLTNIGINPDKLRFRQHLKNEMAHYAKDCWDAEILTTHGWIECVGHADRACFDLTRHSEFANVKLEAEKVLKEPLKVKYLHKQINKKKIQQDYKKDATPLLEYLNNLKDKDAATLRTQLDTQPVTVSIKFTNEEEKQEEKQYQITSEMFTTKEMEKTVQSYNYVPSVVEPSFGIGRILYALLEHSFWERCDDRNRRVLSLPPKIAPIKVCVYPLSANRKEQHEICEKLHAQLKKQYNLTSRIDTSTASPGKKYSRADQMGIPFHVTVDFQTEKDSTITIRERDQTRPQLRVKLSEAPKLLAELARQEVLWQDIVNKYPHHISQEV